MARRRPSRGAGEGLLRPTPQPLSHQALGETISSLPDLDANGLCLQWRNHLGGTPPAHLPRWLLTKILAYRIQATAFGGLDKETLRVLRMIDATIVRAHQHSAGALKKGGSTKP